MSKENDLSFFGQMAEKAFLIGIGAWLIEGAGVSAAGSLVVPLLVIASGSFMIDQTQKSLSHYSKKSGD